MAAVPTRCGHGEDFRPAIILAMCDFGHALRWYHRKESTALPWLLLAPLPKEGAMTERDLTEREDRLIVFWLTAMAIVLVFVFILSNP
jgi:hypothetical protein